MIFEFNHLRYEVPEGIDIKVECLSHPDGLLVADYNFMKNGEVIAKLDGVNEHGRRVKGWEGHGIRKLNSAVAQTKSLFVVRHYDGFDNKWMDVSEPVSKDEAQRLWNEKTDDGKRNAKYDDIDYYAIFPADTVMRPSDEGKLNG
jgi:hypothetical protein